MRWTAYGNSYDPGTDCFTIFSSLTPYFLSSFTQPSTSAEMIFSFQRAWRMPMRSPEPVCVISGCVHWVEGERTVVDFDLAWAFC
jgi:hypothetical protein